MKEFEIVTSLGRFHSGGYKTRTAAAKAIRLINADRKKNGYPLEGLRVQYVLTKEEREHNAQVLRDWEKKHDAIRAS